MRPADPLPGRVAAALADLARAEPSTPVCAYVYDRATLRARATALRDALPAGTTVLYAVKANGHPDVVRTLADATDGLEVASGGELALAEAAGARRIVFGGPAKTDAELTAAVAIGAQLNVESVHELRRLELVAATAGRVVDIALRVNRGGAALSGSHAMTGVATPFGIDEDQLPQALAVAAGLPHLRVTGFHLHAVSNNLDAGAHAGFVTEAVAWSTAVAARHRVRLSLINVGGGFGVDHTGGSAFDLPALAAGLSRLTLPPGAELIVEPGRLLAADAGYYAAEVLDLKHAHGRWFAVLRGGTHHFRLPAAWGYSHPFTVLPVDRWSYPFARPGICGVPVDAVGELCTPRDVLTRAQHVARVRVGDILVFARTGAYGWDVSHHDFLRHPPPRFLVR